MSDGPHFDAEFTDWQRREALLDQLLDQPEATRKTFLAQLDAIAPADAATLRQWLAGIADSTGYLTPDVPGETICHDGERVGNWRVLRLLGRGGMGEVWLGERADGLFERQVAIKFIRDDRTELRRSLESECRLLAGLKHPGIVALLDAGSTAQGHPFLVTDYIDGIVLDAWLQTEQPGFAARLDLFVQVAEAVAHAHGQLVVHRDIKPANVLVDGEGRAHLLDFGIAGMLAHEADATQATAAAMTPEFAAPELAVGGGASVRSDVYALGGLLHFLLCGTPPLALRGLTAAAVVERIGEHVVASVKREAPASWLADLEAIGVKALAKSPGDRYATVESLLRDVQSMRAYRPVSARRPGAWERMRRGLRRHRASASVAAVVGLSLAAGLAGTLWQGQQARQQRDRAEAEARRATEQADTARATRDFLVGVFEAANPEQTLGDTPSALDLLETGARRVETDLAGQPGLQAELYGALGDTYIGLGRYDLAKRLLDDALRQARQSLGEDAQGTRRLTVSLARAVEAGDGPYDETRIRLQRLLARSAPARDDTEARALDAQARALFGGILQKTGQIDAAAQALARAEDEARVLGDAGQSALVAVLHRQMQLAYDSGKRTQAIAILRQIIAILDRNPASSVTDRHAAMTNLASILRQAGYGDEAEAVLRDVVASNTTIYGAEHPATLNSRIMLARALMGHSDYAHAQSLLQDALEVALRRHGEDSEITALARTNMAALDYAQGRYPQAIALLEQVQRHIVAHYGEESPRALMMKQNLARQWLENGDTTRAETALHELLDGLRAIHSDNVGEALALLGDAARQRGDAVRASDYHRQAIDTYAANGDTASFDVQDHRISLAEDLRDLGDYAAARDTVQTAIAGLRELDAVANAAMLEYAGYVLAQLDVEQGRCTVASRRAIESLDERLAQLIDAEVVPAPLAVKQARLDFHLGLCRQQLDPADRTAAGLAAASARQLRATPLTDPHVRRMAERYLQAGPGAFR